MRRIGPFAAMPLLLLAGHAQEQPAGAAGPQRSTGYAVYRRSPLTSKRNGIVGEIQLLQDSRLPTTPRNEIWGYLARREDDPASPFAKAPARNAVLRIVDRGGRLVEEKQMERPLAAMETASLYGDDRITYLITVDFTAGMGSYNGPITSLVEVVGGKLQWVQALDKTTGKRGQISLMNSLKTVWKIADAPADGAKDVLLVACRPNWSSLADENFYLIRVRYSFDGKSWVISQREEKGFAEADELGALLDRKPFP